MVALFKDHVILRCPSSKGLKVNGKVKIGKSVKTGVKMGSQDVNGSQEKVPRLTVDHHFSYLRQDYQFGASPIFRQTNS